MKLNIIFNFSPTQPFIWGTTLIKRRIPDRGTEPYPNTRTENRLGTQRSCSFPFCYMYGGEAKPGFRYQSSWFFFLPMEMDLYVSKSFCRCFSTASFPLIYLFSLSLSLSLFLSLNILVIFKSLSFSLKNWTSICLWLHIPHFVFLSYFLSNICLFLGLLWCSVCFLGMYLVSVSCTKNWLINNNFIVKFHGCLRAY